MNSFFDKHLELLALLIRQKVNFIVVGGYAVVYHGYLRTTGDVDIWLQSNASNKANLLEALRVFGIEEESLQRIEELNFHQPVSFHLYEEPEKIEFLTQISGIRFEEADRGKIVATIDGLPIPFLHLDHLILSKMSTGRQQDLADIEELQKINRSKK